MKKIIIICSISLVGCNGGAWEGDVIKYKQKDNNSNLCWYGDNWEDDALFKAPCETYQIGDTIHFSKK
jgi:hypothetical protein